MADPQTLPLILRNSVTVGAVPDISEFDLNTFVVNRNDGILYWKDAAGARQQISLRFGSGPGMTGAQKIQARKNLGVLSTGYSYLSGSASLAATAAGGTFFAETNATINLPPVANMASGDMIFFQCWGGSGGTPATIKGNGSDQLYVQGAAVGSIKLRPSQFVVLVVDASSTQWLAFGYGTPQGDAPSYNEQQTTTAAQRLQAKRNVNVEIGRRYYTGQPNNKVFISGADLGGLIYLETDITDLQMPLSSQYTDGDYVWLYARGTVNVTVAAGDPYSFGWGVDNSSSFVMRPGDRCKLSLGADAWDVMSYSTRRDKALMADRALTFSDAEKAQLITNADIVIPHGQCRLGFISATQIRLDPFNGNKIFINGNYRTIPAAGITAPNTGLSASTLYYVFAYWDVGSASIKLAIGIGAPKIDPVFGHFVADSQGSDAQNRLYTLVGMVFMNGSAQFQSDQNARWVASHFNRQLLTVSNTIFSNGGTNSNSWIGGNVLYMLNWADMPVRAYARARAYGAAPGAQGQTRIMLDGATQAGIGAVQTFYAQSAYGQLPNDWIGFLAAGMHYFHGQILASGGGANFNMEAYVESWI